MLTLCSFLRSLAHFVTAPFVTVSKKLHQYLSVLIVGALVMVVMTGISGFAGAGGRNTMTVFAETPMEQMNETRQIVEMEMPTEAKIPFQLTNLSSIEEGQKLVGETLAESVTQQQGIQEQRQEMIEQSRELMQLREEEQDRIEAEAAAERAKEEAAQAAAEISISSKDYEVLTRIVQAESGGCDIKGRILIANVIFNRVRSDDFPDTISDVVYQKSQFSPVSDGSMNSCTVTDATVEAVDRALAGEDYSEGALYFMNRELSRSHNVTWFDQKLTYLFEYDRHEFFK